jgi:hypothetical protein
MGFVLVRRDSGCPIAEVGAATALTVDREHFEVMPAAAWVGRYNRLVASAGGAEPSAEAFLSAVAS